MRWIIVKRKVQVQYSGAFLQGLRLIDPISQFNVESRVSSILLDP